MHTKITFFSRRTKEERCPLTGILTYKITEKFFIRFAGGIRINFMLIPHRVKPHQVFCPMEELQSRSTGEWIFGFFLQIQVGGQALGTQRWTSSPLILFFAKHSSSFGISRLPKEPPAEALSCKQGPAKLCLLDKIILLTPANFPCKMLSNTHILNSSCGKQRARSAEWGLICIAKLPSVSGKAEALLFWFFLWSQVTTVALFASGLALTGCGGAFIPGSLETAQGVISSLECSETEPIFSTGLAAANAQAHY